MQSIAQEDLSKVTDLVYQKYGYDFRNYAMSSFERRIVRMLELKRLTVGSLLQKLSHQPEFVYEFMNELTVNVTEMFRDDGLWTSLQQDIIPEILRNKQRLKIWHAGCSSGEEVYSMAIMLQEMGLASVVTVVATDLDQKILAKAKQGSFPLKSMALNEKNYQKFTGNENSLQQYYTVQNGLAIFDTSLVKSVSFVRHDLVTGPVFNQFDLILCRNVMIYFNQALQNEVLKKFYNSLCLYGFLAIGAKESLIWCDISNKFAVFNNDGKIYRKIKD